MSKWSYCYCYCDLRQYNSVKMSQQLSRVPSSGALQLMYFELHVDNIQLQLYCIQCSVSTMNQTIFTNLKILALSETKKKYNHSYPKYAVHCCRSEKMELLVCTYFQDRHLLFRKLHNKPGKKLLRCKKKRRK